MSDFAPRAVVRPRYRRVGRQPAQSVKSIRGTHDAFDRLRVGDYRVMCDALTEDRVLLVLGIVQRGDLEQWQRRR